MQVTLNYWSKGNAGPATQTTGRVIERIYVNVAGTRDAIGYFERRENWQDRGHGSYYDRHRQAKGDTVVADTSKIAWCGPDGVDVVILDALFGTAKVGLSGDWRACRYGGSNVPGAASDEEGLWRSLQEKSRGFNYFVTKRPKTARDKEIAAANKARQEAVYDINL